MFMTKNRLQLLLTLAVFLLTGCVGEPEFPPTPRGNFEALWKIMDEHYCFFTDKQVDWNAVHDRYAPAVDNGMNDAQLMEVMTAMLSELKDGHVNLFSSFDVGRYWGFYEDYPPNYSDALERRYLGTDYRIAGGMQYRVLDDNIGFLRCSSFMSQIGAGNLDQILLYFAPCRGLIIDVRQNGGGMLTSAEELAARFFNAETLVGFMQHKTGRGHDDFSPLQRQVLKPGKGVRWQKPVVVLTNRQVFSAANEFVKYMKYSPHAIVLGDSTGGGAGLPFSSELPNGWGVRFSACPMYDSDMQTTENGIAPDVPSRLQAIDAARGYDTLIEDARAIIRNRKNNP